MPDGGPARYVQLKGTDMRIGFIAPILRHFCMTCNRMRLMGLYMCV
jgi:cyclic pyranopterin phosphate synthase